MTAAAILASPHPYELISRQAAIAGGLIRYFTGKPCVNGHVDERQTSSGDCFQCVRERQARKRQGVAGPARVLLIEAERKRRKSECDRRYREANPLTDVQKALRLTNQNKRRAASRDAENERAQRYYWQDPEKYRARSRAWREENIEKASAAFKEWASRNQPRLKAYRAERHRRRGEVALALARAWKAANRDRVAAQMKRWRSENPEACKLHAANRRARILGNGGTLSKGLARRLLVLQRNKCACCRVDLRVTGRHLDHIEPLARGGRNEDRIMQLLCPPCNHSKHARPPIEFMQSRGYLL